jgi:hypothetical protein
MVGHCSTPSTSTWEQLMQTRRWHRRQHRWSRKLCPELRSSSRGRLQGTPSRWSIGGRASETTAMTMKMKTILMATDLCNGTTSSTASTGRRTRDE